MGSIRLWGHRRSNCHFLSNLRSSCHSIWMSIYHFHLNSILLLWMRHLHMSAQCCLITVNFRAAFTGKLLSFPLLGSSAVIVVHVNCEACDCALKRTFFTRGHLVDTFLMLDQSHLACELVSAVTFNDLVLQMFLQRLPRVESLGAIVYCTEKTFLCGQTCASARLLGI